jgi:predicted glycosyltransferase
MSEYIQKEGTGASFQNKKMTSESSPKLLGTLTIPQDMAGKKVNIASWLNEKGDMKYYSHKLSLIEEKPKSTNVDISSDPF